VTSEHGIEVRGAHSSNPTTSGAASVVVIHAENLPACGPAPGNSIRRMYVRTTMRALIIVLAGFLAVGLVLLYLQRSIFSFDCEHEILSQTTSPDGLYVATVSERACGAVTHDYEVVSIRGRGTQFDGEDKKSWVFWIEGRPQLQVGWASPKRLTVLYPSAMGKRNEIQLWQGVEIATQELRR